MAEAKETKEKTVTIKDKKLSWVKMKPAELEKIVVDLAKKGANPAKIGLILRDEHGIPKAKLLGKRITEILKENNINFKTDKEIIQERLENIKVHMGKNKHDYSASRALTKKLWMVHKIKKQNS